MALLDNPPKACPFFVCFIGNHVIIKLKENKKGFLLYARTSSTQCEECKQSDYDSEHDDNDDHTKEVGKVTFSYDIDTKELSLRNR